MLFLYTNYQGENVRFYDLLEVRRPYGSNESEQVLEDNADKEFWQRKLNSINFETVDLPNLQGIRAYRKMR